MIKTTVMPKETLVQLLLYLAENERFSSVSEPLEGGMTVEEVRAALRELARELSREASAERTAELDEIKKGSHLTSRTKEIISYLSDHEEKRLLSAFGLFGK